MDESISKVIRDLREKQRELREKAEKIDLTIRDLQELFGGQMSLPVAGSMVQVQGPSGGIYRGLSIGQAGIKFLRSAGEPQKTRDIANALEQGGIQSSDMYRAVYNALTATEEAFLTEDKRWALKEWEQR